MVDFENYNACIALLLKIAMNFLKKDFKEEARILRRRQNEEERKKRIFDPRTRLFGVDVNAWEKQMLEKRKSEEAEKCENALYEARKFEQEQLCLEMEKSVGKQKRELEKRLVEFREVYQKPWGRREYDLNDPEALKKSFYAENGVSKFDGEDETYKKRLDYQKAENRAWLIQQMAEKKQIKTQQEATEQLLTKRQFELEKRSMHIAQLEKQCQRKLEEATAEYNKMMAQEKSLQTLEEIKKDAKIEAQEMQNWMNGDFLTENPVVANSALGPGRVIPYMYKGESPVKAVATREEQHNQTIQQKMRESQLLSDKIKWENYEKSINCNAKEKINEFIEDQRKLDKEFANINAQLAEEQKKREIQNNSKYDLRPRPPFFDQFNRSTY